MEQAKLTNDQSIEIGQTDEAQQIRTLRANGFVIESATKSEDINEKIDCFLVLKNGTREAIQIKGRDRNPDKANIYVDLLSDVYEPYCGLGHPDTKIGRDEFSAYKWYTCRIKEEMVLVSGAAHKDIIKTVLAEWEESENRKQIDRRLSEWVTTLHRVGNKVDWEPNFELFREFRQWTFESESYPGVQIKCTQDKRRTGWQKNRPKLLVFVPISSFQPKHVRRFKLNG
jgi:hypothetical protein